jgi:hypothetical protein
MSDPSLPLTVKEFEEWGNPQGDRLAYNYMLSYSPYDNLRTARYPAVLATAGLNDPRVPFWEPAKYVARLRELNPNATALLVVNMGAGHFADFGLFCVAATAVGSDVTQKVLCANGHYSLSGVLEFDTVDGRSAHQNGSALDVLAKIHRRDSGVVL